MKKLLFVLIIATFVACSNGTGEVDVDSSNVITDSSALMDADTTTTLAADYVTKGN